MNSRLLFIASLFAYSLVAIADDISGISPGADISDLKFTGYTATRHDHPSEAPQPCIVLTNSTNEIHALLDRQNNNKVIAVYINKGSSSPVSVKIGDSLAKLKAAFPSGKIIRYDSELIDPVSFRVEAAGKKLAFTVEWESTFYAQEGKWETFNAGKIPDHARVLAILWE